MKEGKGYVILYKNQMGLSHGGQDYGYELDVNHCTGERRGALAASFKKHKIQATRIDAEGLVSSRRLNVFLVGTDRVEEVLGLVEANCRERTIEMEDKEYNGHIFVDVQRTIVIGGATVFLMGEARLMKIKGLYNE